MKSPEFLKPALATTLAIVLAWLLSVRPAQAGYTVTLQQVGPDVVASCRHARRLPSIEARSRMRPGTRAGTSSSSLPRS